MILPVYNDYYLFFENSEGNITGIGNVTGVGKPGVNFTNVIEVEDPDNLFKIYRYCLYNSEIIRMGLYVW